MKAISSSAGHEDGVINWPVGDTIRGPASLKTIIKISVLAASRRMQLSIPLELQLDKKN